MRRNDNNNFFNFDFLVIGYANFDLGSLDTLKLDLLKHFPQYLCTLKIRLFLILWMSSGNLDWAKTFLTGWLIGTRAIQYLASSIFLHSSYAPNQNRFPNAILDIGFPQESNTKIKHKRQFKRFKHNMWSVRYNTLQIVIFSVLSNLKSVSSRVHSLREVESNETFYDLK